MLSLESRSAHLGPVFFSYPPPPPPHPQAEISMIGRLKELCGYEYTSKLQRMLNDVRTSGDLASEFHSTAPGKALQLHFQPLVLQTGAWPLGNAQPVEISLPAELCACVNAFEHYYTVRGYRGAGGLPQAMGQDGHSCMRTPHPFIFPHAATEAQRPSADLAVSPEQRGCQGADWQADV